MGWETSLVTNLSGELSLRCRGHNKSVSLKNSMHLLSLDNSILFLLSTVVAITYSCPGIL
jgi:hypothetical protein